MSKLSTSIKRTASAASAAAPRVSKIRRDPPPIAKKASDVRHRSERERQVVLVGVTAFALAIFIIILGIASNYLDQGPVRHTLSM